MLYLLTSLTLAIYLVFAWLLPSWMHLHQPALWMLRAGLILLGGIAAGFVVWLRRHPQNAAEAAASDEEIDLLFRAASAKLRAAKYETNVGSMPVVAVLGFSGSAKTSIMQHSGVEPELLAGAVAEDVALRPTPTVNIWFAGGTLFVEASGTLLLEESKWRALLHRLQPARLRSAFRAGPQASRSALVCFDAEKLVSDPTAAVQQVKLLRGKLNEFADALGSEVPVYALFTRSDKIPHFPEFAATLNREEAESVLGSTLRLGDISPGLYAAHQSARLEESLEGLFRSLADARPELLQRVRDEAEAGCVYEFAREFRKLRSPLGDVLLELCRPGQFSGGPVLRGYYFSGVRPVVVERPAQPIVSAQASQKPASQASMIFRAVALEEPMPEPSVARISQRVPQWILLQRLFRDVLLADQTAKTSSGFSAHTVALRRLLLVSVIAASLFVTLAFTISWMNNRALASNALAAVDQLNPDAMRNGATTRNLQSLDSLRSSVQTLADYSAHGVPLFYRLGLFSGDRLYPALQEIYFDRFKKLLLTDTQSAIETQLRNLSPKPASDYGVIYDSLKAYLITTTGHEHSTVAFLAPVLLDRWSKGRNVNSAQISLAQRQFAFYAEQLKAANPFHTSGDTDKISHARDYLSQFGSTERIYRAILAEAANRFPEISFNRQYPDARGILADPYVVSGAFTSAGWGFVRTAIQHPAQYFSGETWVLGTAQDSRQELKQSQTILSAHYNADFVNAWRAYLKNAELTRYGSLADAAHKLNILSSNRSPLLELLALASQNTSVMDAAVSGAFQAVQAVVPPSSTQTFIAPQNQNYMSALLTVQSALEQVSAQSPGASDAGGAVIAASSSARVAARQLAQTFRPDPAGRVDVTVEKLLEEPIIQVEMLAKTAGADQLNGKVKSLCGELAPLFAKYPFKRNSTTEASIAEMNSALRRSDGAFWSFYAVNLQKFIDLQGSHFVVNAASQTSVSPAALAFLDRVAELSSALYPNGVQDPQLAYTLAPEPTDGIEQLDLVLDGQSLTYTGGAATPKQFVWKGSTASEASASVRFGNGPNLVWAKSDGPWAVFHFFDRAEQFAAPSATRLEWKIRVGKDALTLPNGKPLTVRLDLSGSDLPLLLGRMDARQLSCTAIGGR